MTKLDEMKKIGDELLVFKESPLYVYRTENDYMPVVGEGSLDASILFVGEAPGKKEAETGKPFCGASGKFLSELLSTIGLEREKVYITNIVKDRPPENRDPTEDEIRLYGPFLDKQIEIIHPRVIVTLGRYSMDYVMKKFGLVESLKPIGQIHGMMFEAHQEGKAGRGGASPLMIVTLYHPAAALYNGGMRETLKKDFGALRRFVK